MPAQRGRGLNESMTLTGYFIPEDKSDAEADEFEDDCEDNEDEQPEFLDLAEIDQVSSGGQLFNSPVPVCKVDFRTLSGEAYQVEGSFPLIGPWWEVTCVVVHRRDWFVMKGFPSYKLRSDLDREDWIHIVSLFLTACGVEDQYKTQLFEWLPDNVNVSLHNLMDVLEEFFEGGNEDQARMIIARVSASDAWMQVEALRLYPGVSEYLPKLLPRQFTVLLGLAKKGPTLPTTQATQVGKSTQQHNDCQEEGVNFDLLDKLEQIIAHDVWMLGFSNLVYEELKLVRCEAQLRAFEECNLLQTIPAPQCHALMAYNELKKHCRFTGSTFMNHADICKILTKHEKMSDDQAWEAIHFLKEKTVVVLDSPCVGIGKVAIQKFDFYETGIAECLRSLLEQGRWNIPVNPVEILQAAAEERQREKSQNSKEATSHTVEDTQSVSVSTNIPDLPGNGRASPSVKSEPKLDQKPPSVLPEQQTINACPVKLDGDHIQAAKMICANPVTVISGKAGCGKTTVVSQLFRAAVLRDTRRASSDGENDTAGPPLLESEDDANRAIQSDEEILLTAPTGRAASLLSKKTNFEACTLHQVLFSFMRVKKKPERWAFKNVRVLVVDEGSMVAVQLLHSVLNLLIQHGDLRKFVILGDVRQLPSIEPGNVLNDLYNTLKRVGWAIDMKTNHRAESQLIIENASLIADIGMNRKGNLPVKLKYDAVVDLVGSHTAVTADKRFILIRLPANGANDDLQTAVRFLINNAPGMNDHCTSQFIAFKRNDVLLINELCCKHYSDHTTKNHKNKLIFQPGDKVCCTKNGRVKIEDVTKKKDLHQDDAINDSQNADNDSSMRLCNGEIFFIKEDVTKVDGKRHCRYLTLDDGDGRIFTVDFRELQKECKLRHAWARTIHTYQGSENETIVYIVGDSRAQRWKHIYTAITRGQKRVYVVSKEEVIESTIKRHEIPRNTRLGGLVKEYVVQGQELVGTPQARPNTPRGTQAESRFQQTTPVRTQTPGRPLSSGFRSTSFQPKWLWKTEGEEEEEEEEEAAQSSTEGDARSLPSTRSAGGLLAEPPAKREATEGDGAATSAGRKRQRPLSAEHEEVPCKQTHTGGC